MASPIFQLTHHDLQWIIKAKDAVVLGQRVAALAAKYGVSVSVIRDAVWASGTIGGHAAKTAAQRAAAQALARGAARRMGEVGARTIARHAAGHAARVGSVQAAGGLGAALGTVGTVLGVTLLVGVLAVGAYAAHRVYTTSQARSQAVDLYSPPSIFGPGVDEHGNDIPGVTGAEGGGVGQVAGGSPSRSDIEGRWVVDVAAVVDHWIRKGRVKRSERARAMAEFPKTVGRPVLDIRPGGVVYVRGLTQGARNGRWTRSGSQLTIRSGRSSQIYRIERDVLVAETGDRAMYYRRAY